MISVNGGKWIRFLAVFSLRAAHSNSVFGFETSTTAKHPNGEAPRVLRDPPPIGGGAVLRHSEDNLDRHPRVNIFRHSPAYAGSYLPASIPKDTSGRNWQPEGVFHRLRHAQPTRLKVEACHQTYGGPSRRGPPAGRASLLTNPWTRLAVLPSDTLVASSGKKAEFFYEVSSPREYCKSAPTCLRLAHAITDLSPVPQNDAPWAPSDRP